MATEKIMLYVMIAQDPFLKFLHAELVTWLYDMHALNNININIKNWWREMRPAWQMIFFKTG